ncbi:MAG: ELM1/GtrOC1 family putative glycosyltransferase [Halioglobus sp.]|nr:ELM1/GtrOC1 family putative glycosyltransferase [Halioglobus sp.]
MPVIWLIDAYRAGERGQVRALVDALGWPYKVKVLSYRNFAFLPHALGQSTLRGITSESAATLGPPWPDLVISSGVRNEPVCRWIRAESGDRTHYVHVGRPWGALDSFDLVITTPQYRVPSHPKVLNNMLTLHRVTAPRLAQARIQWESTFADLPSLRIAVMVGGDSGPFTLGPQAAARLGAQASRMAKAHGGSLLVSTSSRTCSAAQDALQSAITAPSYFYRWPGEGSENPYEGILAWADRLIVTGDSIAMLSEALATGKPVAMFDVGGMRDLHDPTGRDFRLGGVLYAALLRWFWQPLSRDITLVHSQLHETGCATWMEEAWVTPTVPAQTDMQRAVEAVRKLLSEG